MERAVVVLAGIHERLRLSEAIMERRRFLQSFAALSVASAVAPARLWAAPKAERQPKFLLVFLRGGYDAANVLVPYRSDFYYAARPHIAVPRPGSVPDAAVALDGDWALHPALRDSLMPLWQARQLAFVPFAGTDDLSRSHFETQDHIELGQGPLSRNFNDGFLNRLAEQIGAGAQPMAFTAQVPLSMRGGRRIPNLVLAQLDRNTAKAEGPEAQQALLQQMWRGTAEESSVREGFAARDEVLLDMQASDWEAKMTAASRGAINARGFVAEAAGIGSLMRESFNLGFVDVGGWDTHVNEAGANGAEGQLATRLGDLGDGLAALAKALGPAWRDTTVVVISEFGRTFRENGNRGTDHGHGTVYWILGGSVKGGRIGGDQVMLSAATLNQDRDYPVLTNDRELLGGIFRRQWGLSSAALQAVFPGAQARELELL
jgi:uncharacterized protein (DUF1501 family)